MLTNLKQILKRNKFIRNIYFGGKSCYKRLRGPRLRDLDYKLGILYKQANNKKDFFTEYTSKLKIIEGAKAKEKRSLAFVTILPADNSGIATTSLYSFLDSERQIDIFSPTTDSDSYILNSIIMEENKNIRLFDSNDLILASKIFCYEKIVIAIGNSSHHFYIIPLLKRLKENGLEKKVVLYFHDVYLWNILFDGQYHNFKTFKNEVLGVYKSNNLKFKSYEDKWGIQRELIHDYELCGAKLFKNKFGVKNILTNSKVAEDIIKKDLGDDFEDVKMDRIFLPLITKYANKGKIPNQKIIEKKIEGCCYVGSFGVLTDAKRIDDLLKVFSKFEKKGLKIKLVLAGWGAKQYITTHKDLLTNNIIIIDSPNDQDLIYLMKYVDFAVQLRKFNTGESSGVVPMLLELGKTVLVSRIGSFAEFGEEVIFTNSDSSIDEIEVDILSMISHKTKSSSAAIEKFVEDHSISKFTNDLFELYSK